MVPTPPALPAPEDPRGAAHWVARRAGYSLPEMLIVVSIIGIMALAAGPKLSAYRNASAVRAARLEVATVLEAARAAAMQRGRTARMTYSKKMLSASVDTSAPSAVGAAPMVTLTLQSLDSAYRVTVTTADPADTLITYDARGYSVSRRAAKLFVQRAGIRDSVCVTEMGLVLPRGCTL